jgi:hypothetical protein
MEEVRNSIGKMEEENKEAEGKAAIPCFPKWILNCTSPIPREESELSHNTYTVDAVWHITSVIYNFKPIALKWLFYTFLSV